MPKERTKELPIWSIKLKRFRLANGLSQKEFAELLSLSQPSITAYERGIKKPSSKTMERMNKILGLDINYIFFDETLNDLREKKFKCKK